MIEQKQPDDDDNNDWDDLVWIAPRQKLFTAWQPPVSLKQWTEV